jgi:hypothetical protein
MSDATALGQDSLRPTPEPFDAVSSSSLPPDQHEHAAAIRQLVDGESAWDRRFIAWSDWVNPILVKETRQALKSKQFSWTLLLLTVIVLGWSLMAIVGMIPSIYYASNGSALLSGYILILVVPALIIIPQAMFRSMASELEDGTFETLSLSILSPRAIIAGKLSVAILQLMIYLSVIAPCIALTYLLRGVTLEVIAMNLLVMASTSVALSAVAISVASFSKSRVQQVFYSILLLVGQLICAYIVCGVSLSFVYGARMGEEAWIIMGVFLVGEFLYGWLLLRCGTCAIGVVSENRSTPIRIPLLVIGLLMAMLQGFFCTFYADRNFLAQTLAVSMTFLFAHWGIAGSMMMGEQGIIPARARRSLPSSLLGRMFLTWMNPGAGPGYIFVILSFAGPAITMVIMPWILVSSSGSNINNSLLVYAVTLIAYLALYLGVVRLFSMVVLRKLAVGRLAISFALTAVLLVMTVIGTCSLSLASNDYQTLTYEWFCFPNLFWTMYDLFPGNTENWVAPEYFGAFVALLTCSGAIALINLLLTAKDVVLLRIETPERVTKERKKIRVKSEEEEVEDPDPLAISS